MKLMVVDDEISILKTMKKIFERDQHECLIFENPRDAVIAYPIVKPDVVITDLKMPSMHGIDLLKEIKKIDRNAYVIILTGHADTESAISAVNYGACAFFRKPLVLGDILNMLSKIERELKEKCPQDEPKTNLYDIYESLKDEMEKVKHKLEELASLHIAK